MKRLAIVAVTGLMLAAAALRAETADSETAQWKTYRAESGEYEIRYPSTLSLSNPTGTACTDGECKAIEETGLRGSYVVDGRMHIRFMQFHIQRGINPQRLAIRQWYEALAHRPLNASETLVSVGGKTAIHRGPLTEGVRVEIVDGKTVATSKRLLPDNHTFVPLNETDVLDIKIGDGTPEWTAVCTKVLSTLTFTK